MRIEDSDCDIMDYFGKTCGRFAIIRELSEESAEISSGDRRTITSKRSSSKRYAVCISPRGILSTASHERVARDREPVCRNFRKFQNDVAELLSAGVRVSQERTKTHGSRFSFLSFVIYSYLRNEARASLSLLASLE